jgi:hypothetical protein
MPQEATGKQVRMSQPALSCTSSRLSLSMNISLCCGMPKTPKVVPIKEDRCRTIAEDKHSKRFILGIGKRRIAFDFTTLVTDLPEGTCDQPARLLPMKSLKGNAQNKSTNLRSPARRAKLVVNADWVNPHSSARTTAIVTFCLASRREDRRREGLGLSIPNTTLLWRSLSQVTCSKSSMSPLQRDRSSSAVDWRGSIAWR